ncbi:membrane fraction protein [Phellopilus nigrolimitatus]|nr:membrane fraction protein [Phellopilus nigrolimitatus]
MSAPSVPLPRRETNTSDLSSNHPPIWAVANTGAPAVDTPLPSKCDRHSNIREGVCCKELKGDDERSLVDPDVVRDVVIGLSDGLTVPFALTAGLSSLGESKLVVLGGVAELIAGAISMGVGGFLASQSERDHYRYLHRQTTARVLRSCSGEMEREVHAVLGPIGVDDKLSRQVAQNLLNVEVEANTMHSGINSNGTASGGDVESSGLRWSKDVGLTAFLLKFGEGMEEVPTKRLYISAFTIGMGYLLGGLIPLLPYFFIPRAHVALLWSALVTGVTLLVFGVVKTHVSGAQGGWRGYVWGAVSTLFVGGAAAAAAYGIVAALERGE